MAGRINTTNNYFNMELPQTMQTSILKRALTAKELQAIGDSYERAKLRTGHKEPTPMQRKFAQTAKEYGFHEAAKKLKVNVARIQYATQKVGAYNYLNA